MTGWSKQNHLVALQIRSWAVKSDIPDKNIITLHTE